MENEPPADWNAQLLKNSLGNIFNSIEYTEYARSWLGWKPIFYRILDSTGNIILHVILFEYIPPSIEKIPTFLHGIMKKVKNSVRWNHGPISSSQDAMSFFFAHIKEKRKTVYGTTHPLSLLNYDYLEKTAWSTFLIDLTKSKNELYGNLSKHNARKNIERAIERGVVVEEIENNSIKEYAQLLDEYRKSMNLTGINCEETLSMWKILKPAGFSGFIAKKDGIPIGGLLFSFFNNYINEWGVARSTIDKNEKLYAQDLIKWKIIEWGVERNMNWYDLSGANPNPKTEKEKGILEYKKKWGGTEKNYWIISGK